MSINKTKSKQKKLIKKISNLFNQTKIKKDKQNAFVYIFTLYKDKIQTFTQYYLHKFYYDNAFPLFEFWSDVLGAGWTATNPKEIEEKLKNLQKNDVYLENISSYLWPNETKENNHLLVLVKSYLDLAKKAWENNENNELDTINKDIFKNVKAMIESTEVWLKQNQNKK